MPQWQSGLHKRCEQHTPKNLSSPAPKWWDHGQKKTAAPSIPMWSPTIVLTRPALAYLRRSDGMRSVQVCMAAAIEAEREEYLCGGEAHAMLIDSWGVEETCIEAVQSVPLLLCVQSCQAVGQWWERRSGDANQTAALWAVDAPRQRDVFHEGGSHCSSVLVGARLARET